MSFGLAVLKRAIHALKREVNRYYIIKLRKYSQKKVLALSNYLKVFQFNPALVICSITLSINFSLIPLLLLILLTILQEFTLVWVVLTSRQNINYLSNVQWNRMAEISHNCLQYIKYSRMVSMGYELRANTNIMLHDQTHNCLFVFEQFNQRQFKLQTEIIKVYKQVVELYSVMESYFSTKYGCLKQIKMLKFPLNFRIVFQMNHNLGIIFSSLQNTNKLYTLFVNNQLNKLLKIVQITYFIRFSFSHSMNQIRKSLQTIEKQIQEELKSMQNSKLYHSLKSQLEYQELQQIFHRYSFPIQIKVQQRAQRIDQIIEINGCQQKQIKKETIQVNEDKAQDIQQRKNFMAKLDCLLIMGLARKRQQELQQKLRMQDYNQENTIMQQHSQ